MTFGKKRHPERDLQISVMNYFRAVCPRAEAIHIPNGGYRRIVEAAILKGMGVKAGVPDILVMWEPGRSGFIELKAPKSQNRLSDAQKAFHIRLQMLGMPYRIATSLSDVESIVSDWGIPSRRVAL